MAEHRSDYEASKGLERDCSLPSFSSPSTLPSSSLVSDHYTSVNLLSHYGRQTANALTNASCVVDHHTPPHTNPPNTSPVNSAGGRPDPPTIKTSSPSSSLSPAVVSSPIAVSSLPLPSELPATSDLATQLTRPGPGVTRTFGAEGPTKRGTVRPHSSSDEEEATRPKQKQRSRRSNGRPAAGIGGVVSGSIVLAVDGHRPGELQQEGTTSNRLRPISSPTFRFMSTMGHPLPSSNGVNSNGQTTSSDNNGQGSIQDGLGLIKRVQPAGTLMYEDDRGWAEYADVDLAPDFSDGHSILSGGHGESSKSPRYRAAGTADRRMPIDREEIVRLMLQGLRDIGYNRSADTLEAESGYILSTPAAADFQAAILGGRWSEALALLNELGISSAPSNSEEPSSSSSSIRSGKARAAPGTVAEQVRFEIQVQKYLEFLEVGQKTKALAVLRAELAPVSRDPELLHDLSGHMMSIDKEDLYERASWDGAAGTSRRRLLESVQKHISPKIMVPSRRLATLLDQARRHQIASCPYHQELEPTSLYMDHECKSGHFPSLTTHILGDHTDEVWRIEWSPDGMMLASAGKDQQVVIWQLQAMPKTSGVPQYSVSPLHHLRDHRDPVDAMAWSPDGETLVTAAHRNLYIWAVKTGIQRPSSLGPSQHNDDISSIQWKPDGSEFMVASLDCKIIFYSPTGSIVRQWAFNTLQIKDFAITADSNHIVAVTTSLKRVTIESKLKPSMSSRHIDLPDTETGAGGGGVGISAGTGAFAYEAMENVLMVIRLSDREIVHWTQDLKCELTSVKLSSDGKKVLISCNPDEVQLWSVEPHLRFVRKFYGHMQNRFLIRSCFGAIKDRFVLSGSEDGQIYVYQSNASTPIEVLSGHRSVVNAVAWNPVASRRIFASCSDDGEVRIWQPPLGVEGVEEGVEVKMEDDAEDEGEGMVL